MTGRIVIKARGSRMDTALRDALLAQSQVLGNGNQYAYYGQDTPGGILLQQLFVLYIDDFCRNHTLIRMEDMIPIVNL